MSKIQSEVIWHTKAKKSDQFSGEWTINKWQAGDYPNVVMVKNFKAIIVTILHKVKINTPHVDARREALSRETETIKYSIWNLKIQSMGEDTEQR